jgi:hypothetical protein
MALIKEETVCSALEYACEDINLAFSEVAKPDFDDFPKTKHALLVALLNYDRENLSIAAERAVMNAARGVHSILENNLEPEVAELAELLAEKLRDATKEDKRIVSAILMEVL